MKKISFTPEELAKVAVHIECIHEILFPYKDVLVYDTKKAYKLIDNGTKMLLKQFFGDQSLEELDIYRDKVSNYTHQIVANNFNFKD